MKRIAPLLLIIASLFSPGALAESTAHRADKAMVPPAD